MGFAPGAGDVVLLQVDADEQRILSDLCYGVLELLADGRAETDDAVLQRWFPDAYADDPDAAAEFRRFTTDDLTRAKRAAAVAALETLDEPGTDGIRTLPTEAGLAWMSTLNDIRLALGTRMGEMAEVDEATEALYDWLTWLQETLVRSMP